MFKVLLKVQLPTWLGHLIKSGEVSLLANDKETIHLKAENKKIDLIVLDEKIVKDVVGDLGGFTTIMGRLYQIKSLAGELRDEGLTLIISYKGKRVATIGAGAKPKISNALTGTKNIEINSLHTLVELGF